MEPEAEETAGQNAGGKIPARFSKGFSTLNHLGGAVNFAPFFSAGVSRGVAVRKPGKKTWQISGIRTVSGYNWPKEIQIS
ncbi:MAG: hypothetical protein JXB25_12885 [Deltaproteobacteria bacterium]|nr:hypothetical protein [Deltaproteobacteria bacterium]